ncbi:MAG: hypothetical protein R3E98_20250 [Gemmatimonadota bacterium]
MRPPGLSTRSALALAALIGLSAVLDRPAVVDVRTGLPPADAVLVRPPAYVLLSPVAAVLDSLSLLALSQHIALLLSVLVAFGLWRWRRRPAHRTWGRALLVEPAATLGCLAVLVGIYAVMTFVPRPVPRLEVLDPDLLVVDFHSHTEHSHDVGPRYPVEWNRRVHVRGGFDAAFLTDHGGWDGIPEALASNPATAGEGFVLLVGSELWLGRENTLALGDSLTYRPRLDSLGIRILPERGAPPEGTRPTLLLTLPARRPAEAVGWSPDEPWGLVGLEVNDASPKGLEQGRGERALLLAVAEREDLALVSGSNNHGAGQTAAAWTLLRIPGWRDRSPAELERTIADRLHRERAGATRVIERTLPFPRPWAAVALTALTWPWHVLASLSQTERLVWLLYGTGLWAVGSIRTRRGAGPDRPLRG